MPAHVYIRTGDYEAAVKTNEKAAAVDRAYLTASGTQGIYPMMYYSHNLHFIAMCSAMDGNYLESKKGAELLSQCGPHVKEMPPLEGFMTIPMAVEIRFHKWNEILKMPQPDAAMKTATVFWHFARGLALAGTGKVTQAEAEYKIVSETKRPRLRTRSSRCRSTTRPRTFSKSLGMSGRKDRNRKGRQPGAVDMFGRRSRYRTHSNTENRPTGFFRSANLSGNIADEW